MKKTFWILLGILVLFFLLYFRLTQKEKKRLSPKIKESFLGIDTKSIDKFEIKKLGFKIVFGKKENIWWVTEPENYKADRPSINKFLESAQELKVENLISTNRKKQILFQVDTLTGTRLNFYQGGKLKASVVIGKISLDFTHTYVRKTESDEVYLANTYLTYMLNRTPKGWRDREIFRLDPEEVSTIELSKGKEKFKLIQPVRSGKDTLWMVSPYPYKDFFETKKEKIDQFLKALCYLKTDDFATKKDTEKLDFKNPAHQYKLTLKDGTEKTLSVFKIKKQEGRYFLKTGEDDTVFILFGHSFEKIDKKIDDFKL